MKPKTKHSLSLNTNETKTAAVLTSNLVVDNENWVCRHCLQECSSSTSENDAMYVSVYSNFL